MKLSSVHYFELVNTAVVADEVLSLAKRTQESASEIEKIIDELQKASSEANESMEESQIALQKTVEESANASNALSEILTTIDQVKYLRQSRRLDLMNRSKRINLCIT